MQTVSYKEWYVCLLGARTFDREWGPKSFQEECLFEIFAFDDGSAHYIRSQPGYRRTVDPNLLAYFKVKGLQ